MHQKSKPESSQLGTQPAVTSKPASHPSQNRDRRQGAKPLRFAAPPSRGAGRVGQAVRISESENSGRPRPLPPDPAQSSPKSIICYPQNICKRKSETWLRWEASGHPKVSKTAPKSLEFLLEVSFKMILGKSLATRGFQGAQRTKTRDGNSNPIEPARSKHSLHFRT